ncbi:isopentenyl-diphosphate Delta-isomerase [Colwelliaceae bacterium 6441]
MEEVVLVNDRNEVVGILDKSLVHGKETPLHRAFSLFIFDTSNRLIIQQRSFYKKAWPLIWSNSCCGHPALNESNINAAKRRAKYELGIQIEDVVEVAPYRYCYSFNGIMENEICPILVARYRGNSDIREKVNIEEVNSFRWIDWAHWLDEVSNNGDAYSPWAIDETKILMNEIKFKKWLGYCRASVKC